MHCYSGSISLTSVTVIGLKNTSRVLTIFLWHSQLLISLASSCSSSASISRCLSFACNVHSHFYNMTIQFRYVYELVSITTLNFIVQWYHISVVPPQNITTQKFKYTKV